MIKKFPKPIYVSSPFFPSLSDFSKRLEQVWESGFITNNGQQVKQLEKELATILTVPYLSAFNNGTTALYAAVRYLGLSGEVITTPFTFASTPHVLTLNNIEPVFCDIDPKTYNIDPGKIEALITPKTTGILGVHVFGVPCDVKSIKQIADKHGLKVLYDAAHAFDSRVNGIGIGNFGDMSIFSFHATKLFHTAEGGGIACKNKKIKSKIDQLRNFGIKDSENVITPGLNGKMSEIHAALGLEVLTHLDEIKAKRKKILEIYLRRLREIDGIIPIARSVGSIQYFTIRVDAQKFGLTRDEIHERLKNYNVFTRKYFYPLCSDFLHYRDGYRTRKNNLTTAKSIAQEVLVLPFHNNLSEADANQICDILLSLQNK